MTRSNPFAPPGELIDVGGYRLHLHCTGSGSPTVVLEASAASFSSAWSLVQPEVARFTRVCSYDRAGYAWSDPAPASMPRNSDQVVRELHVLLHRAGIRPPLLLVGHASGSFHVRLYASRFPDDVAGMVLVEPACEQEYPFPRAPELRAGTRRARGYYLLARLGLMQLVARFREPAAVRKLPAHTQAVLRRLGFRPRTLQATYREFDALEQSAAQVREQSGSLGDRPLIVVGSAEAASPASARQPSAERQAELARLSTRGRTTRAPRPAADILLDEPALVVEAIHEVVEAIRAAAGPVPKPP